MSKHDEQHTLVRTLALGFLSGGRSSTPLAVLALNHDNKAVKGDWQQWKVFSTPLGRGLLVASAIGELIGDKSPKAPARISPLGLIGRIGAGAFAGAALGTTGRRDLRIEGAVLGGIGAVVGSFLGWAARKALSSSGLPDPVGALAEDAAVIAGSVKAVSGS
ncbi:DUF4126 domain-containing protein [Curtobacterium sp. SGAir0471]|uniref:DUF4126 family protein n=1 Tax=Curtobacterium sp. SGAir0471 TaxID=2070337 RepID=UPI0010CD020B|nr:DUF4126 family protein [Curtobacterium sp. SGAir0471]QCR44836.1 DUF4126 domain-containing protein [Curtobacterium sp. SGAir0471]